MTAPPDAEAVERVACDDCGRPYGDENGFPDLVVPHDVWAKISPTGDENGLLCPSCMCRRAHEAGLSEVDATFRSGPFRAALAAAGTREEWWADKATILACATAVDTALENGVPRDRWDDIDKAVDDAREDALAAISALLPAPSKGSGR